MQTYALTGPLSYPWISAGLHAYVVGEQLPSEVEPYLLTSLVDELHLEAMRAGVDWDVLRGMATADDGYPVEAELADAMRTVDLHRLADELQPHLRHVEYHEHHIAS